MPKLRDNRLSTLNNKNASTGANTDKNIKYFKRKLYNSRKPTQINKYMDDESSASIQLPENYIGIAQTNYIPCPDCTNLIDIQNHLEQQNEKISCPRCGLYDIDLIVELKRNNKLELLQSAGFPSGSLINPPKLMISDVLVRPSHIKKSHIKDKDTGLMTRVTSDNTINKSKKHINKDFIKDYEENFDDMDKETMKPIRNLINKGLQIKSVYDL